MVTRQAESLRRTRAGITRVVVEVTAANALALQKRDLLPPDFLLRPIRERKALAADAIIRAIEEDEAEG